MGENGSLGIRTWSKIQVACASISISPVEYKTMQVSVGVRIRVSGAGVGCCSACSPTLISPVGYQTMQVFDGVWIRVSRAGDAVRKRPRTQRSIRPQFFVCLCSDSEPSHLWQASATAGGVHSTRHLSPPTFAPSSLPPPPFPCLPPPILQVLSLPTCCNPAPPPPPHLLP